MNNIVVVDHQGLIIYLDFGYQSSYRDVTILHQFELHKGISFLSMMMNTLSTFWGPWLLKEGDVHYEEYWEV
jgi:hypothetical protein